MNDSPILVIGNNGKTGRRVVECLQQLGYATRPVSCSTTPAFDWEQPTTLPAALGRPATDFKTYVQKTLADGVRAA